MPRNKEYDRQQVLEKAVHLFWKKGFRATSMSDVVKVTELNSASLYKEFGGKDGLFEESLKFYIDNILSAFINILIAEPSIKGIENFLEGRVTNLHKSQGYLGCLAMNHLTVKHELTKKANSHINEYCTNLELHLEKAIRNSQNAGEISSKKDPAILASFIAFSVHGFVLYGKHSDKKEKVFDLYKIVREALEA